MRVAEIWRYPVKSLQGERLDKAEIDEFGVEGDRRYAIIDPETGLGLTARRVPELLMATASWNGDGGVRIWLPDGSEASDDAALSAWLSRPVTLQPCQDVAGPRYENVIDFEAESTSDWTIFAGASGPFHDSPNARVSLVSTGTIGQADRRRFRPNLLLDGAGEDNLIGLQIAVGRAVLRVRGGIQRCVMVTRPQPGGITRDLDVLRVIRDQRNGRLAVGAVVDVPATVTTGDPVTVVPLALA